MKFKHCEEAGLLVETSSGIKLNERKFFAHMNYQEVRNFEDESYTIEVGKVRIEDVEKYLSKLAASRPNHS